MSALSDIQVRILLSVLGSEQLAGLNAGLAGTKTAGEEAAAGLSAAGGAAQAEGAAMSEAGAGAVIGASGMTHAWREGLAFTIVGAEMTKVGHDILSSIMGAAKAFSEYDFEQRKAAAALEIWDPASAMYQKLQDSIFATARAVKFIPTQQVATDYYYWASATGTVVKSQKDLVSVQTALIPILQLSAAYHVDQRDAIKGTVGILNQYHLAATDAGHVTEVLGTMAHKSNIEYGDLIGSFKFAGPQAAQMGVSFEQTATWLSVLADAGIRGSQAGRGLAMVMIKLAVPTAAASAALDKVFESTKGLGKSWDATVFPNGKFIGITALINDLAVATANMSDVNRTRFLKTVAGSQNALRVLAPLVSNQILLNKGMAGAIDTNALANQNAHKYFQQTIEILTGGAEATRAGFARATEQLQLLIGQNVQAFLGPVADAFMKVATAVGNFVAQNPALAKLFAIIGIGLGLFLTITGAILAVAGAIALLGAIAGGVGAAGIMALLAPILLIGGVITAIILIVAALAVAWNSDWGGIREKTATVVNAIVGFFRSAIAFLQGIPGAVAGAWNTLVNNVRNNLINPLVNDWNGFVRTLSSIWQAITGAVSTGIHAVQSTIANVQSAITGAWNTFVHGILTVWNVIVAGIQAGANAVVGVFRTLVGAIKAAFDFIEPGLRFLWDVFSSTIRVGIILVLIAFFGTIKVFDTVARWFIARVQDVISFLAGPFNAVLNFIKGVVSTVWNAIVSIITTTVNTVLSVIRSVISVIVSIWTLEWNIVSGIAKTVWAAIYNTVSSVINAALGIIRSVLGAIQSVFSTVWNAILGWVRSVWASIVGSISASANAAKNSVSSALTQIWNFFLDKFNAILAFLRGLFGQFVKVGSDLVNSIVSGLQSAASAITNFFSGVILGISGVFARAWNGFVDIGRNIVQGIAQGIQSLGSWLGNQVANLAKSVIPGPIRDALGIHSPSKVTEELGRFVVQGLALGIVNNGHLVKEAVLQMTGHVTNGISDLQSQLGTAGIDLTSGGTFSLKSSTDHTFKLQVEVTSPDGSVSQLTANQISKLISHGDLVKALEHIDSVSS